MVLESFLVIFFGFPAWWDVLDQVLTALVGHETINHQNAAIQQIQQGITLRVVVPLLLVALCDCSFSAKGGQ